jgi:hypothetical protein
MDEKFPNPQEGIPAGQLPEVGMPYWVQCKDFRCLAVVDKHDKWRIYATGESLIGVTKIYDK